MAERGSLVSQREGRPTWFQRVAAVGERVLGLGFSLFTLPPVNFLRPPASPFFLLPCRHCSMVFIGEVLLGFQTSPSTFPFLFFFFLFCKF
jgi:hypothetical protein